MFLCDMPKTGKANALSTLLDRVLSADEVSAVNIFASSIRFVTHLRALVDGTIIHGCTVEYGLDRDRFLSNLFIQFYGNCGSLRDASAIFDKLHSRNSFSWSLIISSYAQNRETHDALKLFRAMVCEGLIPDRVIFINAISICATLAHLAVGKWIHAFISTCGYASDLVLGTALINMYGKCGSLDEAMETFKNMPKHDIISWTAIIAAHAQQRLCTDALHLYKKMQKEGFSPNRVTIVCMLDAYADKAALDHGKQIHKDAIDHGLVTDITVSNALISLYGKCGKLKLARKVFKEMCYRDVVSWTALTSAYAQHGHYRDAVDCFTRMQSSGIKPDKIAFLIVLSACSHAGFVKEAFDYFHSMRYDYNIATAVEHYNCIVDLLGRLGQMKEVDRIIREMSVEPNATTWMTVLGACNMHLDVERGERAAAMVYKLDPLSATPYVLLSNLYASVGRWDDAKKVRQKMKDMGLRKQQGHSLIEVNGVVHEFVAGDMSHPETSKIHEEWQKLSIQMEAAGYVPDTKLVLHDVDEAEKQRMLSCHSEKLAVVYGIINKPPNTSLCIIKNLRICKDCHNAIKFISKLVGRKIMVRDALRFHLFKNGVCSCADYW